MTQKLLIYANKCLSIAEKGKSGKYLVKARRLRGQVHLNRQDIRAAHEEISLALDLAKQVKNPPQLWKTYIAQGEVFENAGQHELAKESFLNAKEIIDQVASELNDARLSKLFFEFQLCEQS